MEVVINGSTRVGDFGTVTQLLNDDGLDPKLVVVELNGKILPADQYSSTRLADGDTVEIVQFVAGG